MVDLSNWPRKPPKEIVPPDPTPRGSNIRVPGRFDAPFRAPHEGLVPMMPPNGIPGNTTLIFPDGTPHPFRASQLYPAYVTEVVAGRLKREHKWEDWIEWKTKTLDEVSPPRETVLMLSPKSQTSTIVARENGDHPLYPAAGAEHTVDAIDAAALEKQGWRKVLAGPELPGIAVTEKLRPGSRFRDTLSDASFTLDSNFRWVKL